MNVEDDTVYKVPCNDIHCTLHTTTFLSAGVQNDFDDAAIKKNPLKIYRLCKSRREGMIMYLNELIICTRTSRFLRLNTLFYNSLAPYLFF